MPSSQRLTHRDACDLARLVGECRDLRHDPPAWRAHLLAGVRRLTGQAVAMWAELAPLSPGKPPVFHAFMDVGWDDEAARAHYVAYQRQLPADADPFPGYARLVRRTRVRGRACVLREQVCPDEKRWRRSRFLNDFRRPAGHDGFVLSFDAGGLGGTWTHLAVHQHVRGRPPDGRDVRLVGLLHRMVSPLVGNVLVTDGQPGPHRLTPRLRETLALLLEGLPEKLVADRLGVSPRTAHEYVGKIHAHFGVRSRAELMARFIHRNPAARAARPLPS